MKSAYYRIDLLSARLRESTDVSRLGGLRLDKLTRSDRRTIGHQAIIPGRYGNEPRIFPGNTTLARLAGRQIEVARAVLKAKVVAIFIVDSVSTRILRILA